MAAPAKKFSAAEGGRKIFLRTPPGVDPPLVPKPVPTYDCKPILVNRSAGNAFYFIANEQFGLARKSLEMSIVFQFRTNLNHLLEPLQPPGPTPLTKVPRQ